jgi:hypothetical protein
MHRVPAASFRNTMPLSSRTFPRHRAAQGQHLLPGAGAEGDAVRDGLDEPRLLQSGAGVGVGDEVGRVLLQQTEQRGQGGWRS